MTEWQKQDAKSLLAYFKRRRAEAEQNLSRPHTRLDDEIARDDLAFYGDLIAQLEAGLGVRQ